MKPRTARILTYVAGFAALFLFLFLGYGDVLTRAEQDSYVSTSPDTMYYLLSRPWGKVFYVSRWVLLVFKWAAVGALFLSLIYALTARCFDYAFRLPRKWEGTGFVLAVAQIGWMLYRGSNLYYKNEPSLFLLIAIVVLCVTAVLALIVWLITHKRQAQNVESARPYGLLVSLALIGLSTWAALYFNENVIATARLQNLQARQDWEGMIQTARSVKQPSRAVAAYHAIALEETDQLLDGMFDIIYEYPKERLDALDGSEEYGMFLQDANFHAGLVNPAYRCAIDRTVMDGPRLFNFKRLAVCALLNDEKALCRKYLDIIAQNPFEQDFVEKYSAMLNNPKLIEEDAELAHVRLLAPREQRFEQNYQSPAFLGYNVGLLSGSDQTLQTSVAACLYSKDLQTALPRIQILAQKQQTLPTSVQQAIAILAIKHPDMNMLQIFPQMGRFVPQELQSFLIDAKPYSKDRLALRHKLRERWLGTYFYYYYTENNDPDQVTKDKPKAEGGVN